MNKKTESKLLIRERRYDDFNNFFYLYFHQVIIYFCKYSLSKKYKTSDGLYLHKYM